jgi:cell wall-associated NlpC family hydrolase
MSVRHTRLRHALIRPAAIAATLAIATTGLLATAAPAGATDRAATTLAVSPAKVTKTVGQGVTFTWTLTSGGHHVGGKSVEVYTRATTTSTWTHLGTKTLNANGVTQVAFTVQRSTYVLAKFLGTGSYAPSSSYGTVSAVSAIGQRAVTEASRHKGAPYQYGATGPTRFDCSGFTRYVWARLGKSLPHNSGQQYGAVRHVAKANKKIGDLIFIYGSGGIYHVGIYAGNGYFWHAPHTGDVVKKAPIYTSSYYVGRVA